jgi:aspartyl-tRNA(Asn)/glutamyl-tRNA(Gln) amidotransferase subunit A
LFDWLKKKVGSGSSDREGDVEAPTFAKSRRALRRGETTCEALTSSFLERIDDSDLNAFTSVDADGALSHARYLDSQLDGDGGNTEDRPLAGLVLGVKDNICIKGRPLTCGSRMLGDFESVYNATVIEKLRDAGATFIGKTNCDEFGMGSSNETSHAGPVRHPESQDHVPGGSSGGSAAAVAAGLCHAALGSDTGGSVRQPAAFCGVTGLKPTYGRVSRSGLVAHASSLDCIGPLTRSSEDAATILSVIAGADADDATSAQVAAPDYTEALAGGLQGVRVGKPEEYYGDELDDGVRRRLDEQAERLEEAGAELHDVSLPHTEHALAAYYVLATAEASSNLARYDGLRFGFRSDGDDDHYAATRSEGFGPEVKRRVMLGTFALSAGYHDQYYDKACRVRTLIRDDFDRAFEDVDVLLTPTTPGPAFERGARTDDPLSMYRSDAYTVPASLAGVPGLALPAGAHPDAPHLPVGMQLLGRPFDEALLLRVGDALMR